MIKILGFPASVAFGHVCLVKGFQMILVSYFLSYAYNSFSSPWLKTTYDNDARIFGVIQRYSAATVHEIGIKSCLLAGNVELGKFSRGSG